MSAAHQEERCIACEAKGSVRHAFIRSLPTADEVDEEIDVKQFHAPLCKKCSRIAKTLPIEHKMGQPLELIAFVNAMDRFRENRALNFIALYFCASYMAVRLNDLDESEDGAVVGGFVPYPEPFIHDVAVNALYQCSPEQLLEAVHALLVAHDVRAAVLAETVRMVRVALLAHNGSWVPPEPRA